MAGVISLQDSLNNVYQLQESSVWALLSEARRFISEFMKVNSNEGEPTLLIAPESMLISYEGGIKFLKGIPRLTSKFIAPELVPNNPIVNHEKCYVFSLGMCLMATLPAMQKTSSSKSLQHLLSQMAADDPNKRPSMDEISKHVDEMKLDGKFENETNSLIAFFPISEFLDNFDTLDTVNKEINLDSEFQQVLKNSSSSNSSVASLESNFEKADARDMYSSLPTVSTNDEPYLTCPSTERSPSEGLLALKLSKNDAVLPKQNAFQSHGSHYYTPSRKKKYISDHQQAHERGKLYDSADGTQSISFSAWEPTNNAVASLPTVHGEESGKLFESPSTLTKQEESICDMDTAASLGSLSTKDDKDMGLPISPDLNKPHMTSSNEKSISTKSAPERDSYEASIPVTTRLVESTGNTERQTQQNDIKAADKSRTKTNDVQTSTQKLCDIFGPEFSKLRGLAYKTKETKTCVVHNPTGRLVIDVILLNGRTIPFTVEKFSTCRDLFDQVVAHQSLEETCIFGLATVKFGKDFGETFVEFDRKLSEYAPQKWTTSSGRKRGSQKFLLFFRIQFYVENVNQLRLCQTRHLYYLQLRKDILEGKTYCNDHSALKLAGYAVQAEMADLRTRSYPLEDYLPEKIISKLGKTVAEKALLDMHVELKGLGKEVSELQFLKECQALPEYGMLFYEAARSKKERVGSILLGLSVRGIVVYNVHKRTRTPCMHSPWSKLKNLSYANKHFIIEPEGERSIAFFTGSYKRARYILHLSIHYHRFQLLPKVYPSSFSNVTCHDSRMSNSDQMPRMFTASHGKPNTETALVCTLPEGSIISAELPKDDTTVGLRLTGGRNKSCSTGHVPIYVKEVVKGSVADINGVVKEKDIVLKVNQEDVAESTHREAALLFQKPSSSVTLTLLRPCDSLWLDKVRKPPQLEESWSETDSTSQAARYTSPLKIIQEQKA